MQPRLTLASRVFALAQRVALCAAAVVAAAGVAEARPRVERITERRIMRLEAMERRMEAQSQLPPRPADVRRAIRSGAAAPGAGPNAAAPAAAAGQTTAAAPAATARPRIAPQPQQAKPVPAPAAEPAAPVSPAAAVDDGLQSVLVRGEPTPAPAAPQEPIEPIELLPNPSAK